MARRRRHRSARRASWIVLSLASLIIVALTSGLIQFYREGQSFNSASAAREFIVCRMFEWLFGIWVFAVGSCIASFLNVVAYRLPAGIPITGLSFCPHCQVPVRPVDNVPVLGWILLGGRCRACHLYISPRYPTFELIGGLLALSVYLSTVLGHGSNLPWIRTSDLPYGIPINLHYMDERVFYVAAFHGWLLMFLYAGALTSFGGGRLPINAWLVGAVGIVAAIAMRPEIFMLPFENAIFMDWFPFLSYSQRSRALLSSVVSGAVAIGFAWLWRVQDDRRGWVAASFLIGLALGWQAIICILAILAISQFIQTKWQSHAVKYRHASANLAVSQSKAAANALSRRKPFSNHPLQFLWLWTGVFLVCWRWLHISIDALCPLSKFL